MPHPGAYRGNKRQKELKRLQKQQEKRERRQHKGAGAESEPEFTDPAIVPAEPAPVGEESVPAKAEPELPKDETLRPE